MEPAQVYAWQVIVVQARRGPKTTNAPAVPLQTTITYGDNKDSTSLVKETQPLWNFWTQMPDQGGTEKMRFSLTERHETSGQIFVRGEAVLDLSKYRQVGKSFELWEQLVAPKAGVWAGFAAKPALELHLTITYCASHDGLLAGEVGEDTDCQIWTTLGKLDCVIS